MGRKIKKRSSTHRKRNKSGNLKLLFFVIVGVIGAFILYQVFKQSNTLSVASDDTNVLNAFSESLVNQSIWQYQKDGAWKAIDGAGTRIAVDPQGQPWVTNSFGEIWRRVKDTWQKVDGEASDISIGANGDVWVVGKNGEIKKMKKGGGWETVDGVATGIAVAPNGTPWVVNSAGQIWRRVGSKWVNVKGTAKDISISPEGAVWAIGTNSDIWRWNGRSWSKVEGLGERIAVGNDEEVWVVNSAGQIWQLKGDASKWKLIPGSASDVSTGGRSAVWVLGKSTATTPSPTSSTSTSCTTCAGTDKPYLCLGGGASAFCNPTQTSDDIVCLYCPTSNTP